MMAQPRRRAKRTNMRQGRKEKYGLIVPQPNPGAGPTRISGRYHPPAITVQLFYDHLSI